MTCFLKTTMYESGTSTEFEEDSKGATPSWIVSVLKVGADEASSGNSEKPINPRMTSRCNDGLPADL